MYHILAKYTTYTNALLVRDNKLLIMVINFDLLKILPK